MIRCGLPFPKWITFTHLPLSHNTLDSPKGEISAMHGGEEIKKSTNGEITWSERWWLGVHLLLLSEGGAHMDSNCLLFFNVNAPLHLSPLLQSSAGFSPLVPARSCCLPLFFLQVFFLHQPLTVFAPLTQHHSPPSFLTFSVREAWNNKLLWNKGWWMQRKMLDSPIRPSEVYLSSSRLHPSSFSWILPVFFKGAILLLLSLGLTESVTIRPESFPFWGP